MKKEVLIELLMYLVWIPILVIARIKMGYKIGIIIVAGIFTYAVIKVFIGIKHESVRKKLEKYDMKVINVILIIYAIYASLTGIR